VEYNLLTNLKDCFVAAKSRKEDKKDLKHVDENAAERDKQRQF
jgi:hypothetical protein